MGIYDRDYYRESTRRWWTNWGDRQVTLWLVGINVGVFILQLVSRSQPGGQDELARWGDFYLPAILEGQIWRLLTPHFLHNSFGIWHIAFNMFLLYFIGSELEALYGPFEFLAFYLLTALLVSVGKVVLGLVALSNPEVHSLGASGPITAAFILFACHYPYRRILFMFLIPMPAWLLATGVVLVDLLGFLGAGEGGIGYSAHLLGAAFAFAYYKFNLRVLDWLPRFGRARTGRRKAPLRVYEESREPRQPVAASVARPKADESGRNVDEHLEAKLDQVLEKVARYGRESLTSDEQQILMRASEIYKRRRGS